MVVVTSDHGISFEAGGHRRAATGLNATNRNEVLPVPLFVKYPGQTTGAVDTRPVQIVDVLPTIADALNVDLPKDWTFDGHSLRDTGTKPDGHLWFTGGGTSEPVQGDVDADKMAAALRRLAPPAPDHDIYRIGPHGDLVGRPVAGSAGGALPGTSVSPKDPSLFDEVDPRSGYVPALYEATLTGVDHGAWVAIAINGTVAGVAPAFVGRDAEMHIEAVLDPTLFAKGADQVTALLVDDAGTLHPLRTSG